MDQRKAFLPAAVRGEHSITELSRRYAISRKTDFALGRARCYSLTIADSHSRFIIAIVALPDMRTKTV